MNGLENGYDDVLKAQTIWVPLATDTLAGSIVEPPPDGKQYARTNDTANGPAWVENIAKGVHTDDAPPMTPSDGALWWKSSTGALYVFYEDIDSGQWVQVNGTPSPDATISTGDTPPSNPRPNQLWFEFGSRLAVLLVRRRRFVSVGRNPWGIGRHGWQRAAGRSDELRHPPTACGCSD